MSATYDTVGGDKILVKCERLGPENCGCALTVVPLSPPSLLGPIFKGRIFPPLVILIIALYLHFVINSIVFVLLFVGLFLLCIFLRINLVREETVLLIPTVGLQYTKKLLSGNRTETFVHWLDIKNIIINEVIYRQKIIYLLTVIIKDSTKENALLPLFVGSLPRLKCVEMLYQELMDVLKKQ